MKFPSCSSLWTLAVFTFISSLCFTQTSYKVTDLGVLTTNAWSVGRAVNVNGDAAGSTGMNNENKSQAFVYSSGSMKGLGTLGGPSAIGNGINASGVVAGYS